MTFEPTGSDRRAELIDVIHRVRNRWRLKLALRGSVIVVAGTLLALFLSASSLEALRFSPTAIISFRIIALLVFAALGFFAPLRFAALASVPRILALAAGCSVLVEAAQYVLRLDRVSSVDDVLLNTAGAGLAALASRRWWRATARA